VYDASPNIDPSSVTLIDPVAPPLARYNRLTLARSDDSPAVTLPLPDPPSVTSTPRLPTPDCPDRHRTAVSDTHSLLSHPLPPIRPPLVIDADPIPLPTTVKLAAPLLATFTRTLPESETTSTHIPSVTLPVRTPAVTDKLRLLACPPELRHDTAVSDTHDESSHPLPPIRPACIVRDTTPYPAPSTVRLTDPLDPTFDRSTTLAIPTSADAPSVTDPVTTPPVNTTRNVPDDPELVRHRTDDSDCHDVSSHPVHPCLTPLHAPNTPM
jgi:hypothetical protein